MIPSPDSDPVFQTGTPYAAADLIQSFAALQAESRAYLVTLSPDTFFAPQGSHWSPATHVRHLATLARFMRVVLRTPKPLLRVVFGRASRSSRDFVTIQERYRGALAGGARAPYTPRTAPPASDVARAKERLIARFDADTHALIATVSRAWSEPALDRYRLPHPFLGRLTIREMLQFLIYHHAHHLRRIAERAGETRNVMVS